jgi:hypothetical protein
MPIDFLTAPCASTNSNCTLPGITCKSSTKATIFGLCDKAPPPSLPAYIDTVNNTDWIAEVRNPNGENVTFKAIDACVQIFRPDGNLESRCDGVLIHGQILTFVELKDRVSSGWSSKGRDQLTITIQNFIANNNLQNYTIGDAYVCNKQRPIAITSNTNEIQKFKIDTGLNLRIQRVINL